VHVDPFRERQVRVSGPCTDDDVRDTVRCQVCEARVSGLVWADLTDACLFHQPVQPPPQLIGLTRMAQLIDQDVTSGCVGLPRRQPFRGLSLRYPKLLSGDVRAARHWPAFLGHQQGWRRGHAATT
jgi:hypothetical protein